MCDQTDFMAEDFLASTADLAGLLAQMGTSSRQGSSQRRSDERVAQAALANLFSSELVCSELALSALPEPIQAKESHQVAAARPVQSMSVAGGRGSSRVAK